MKLYIGKNKKEAKKISLRDAIIENLKQNGFKMDNGKFSDNSSSWIGVLKNSDDKNFNINFTFVDNGENIENINVWVAPYIIDRENEIKLI